MMSIMTIVFEFASFGYLTPNFEIKKILVKSDQIYYFRWVWYYWVRQLNQK